MVYVSARNRNQSTSKYLLHDALHLGYLTRIKDAIRCINAKIDTSALVSLRSARCLALHIPVGYPAERRPDIKGEDELAGGPIVGETVRPRHGQ